MGSILVLGARGLTGHIVYRHLKSTLNNPVYGSHRHKNKHLLLFRAQQTRKDFQNIKKNLSEPISHVINCIGLVKAAADKTKNSAKKYHLINTKLPLDLASLAEKEGFSLVHISTDAVFTPNSGRVTEKDKPNPKDKYGKSKLAGEPNSSKSINIRTSILGFDPYHRRGLIEWVLSQNRAISGYTNHSWTGCTNLQLAQLFESMIKDNSFAGWRSVTSTLHFNPLGPTTKYLLIKEIVDRLHPQRSLQVNPVKAATPLTRLLASNYQDVKPTNNFRDSIGQALAKLK